MLLERLCMRHCLSWSLCKRCGDGSSVPVISSLTVLPSWPGDGVIPMRPSGMLPLTILVLSRRGFRVHTLICRGSGLPLFFLLSPAHAHDAPFAKQLLAWAMCLYQIRPRVVRLDAAYWGLHLIAWIHGVLGAVAVIAWNPKKQKKRSCLPPTWTKEELGKRSSIERFVGRVLLFFHLQRPPLCGWSALASQVALTYAASLIVGLAARACWSS
jgi:transposase